MAPQVHSKGLSLPGFTSAALPEGAGRVWSHEQLPDLGYSNVVLIRPPELTAPQLPLALVSFFALSPIISSC